MVISQKTMKHEFLRKDDNRKLLLFFSGWGSAPCLFREYGIAEGHDCLMCYDYDDLFFDRALLEGYGQVDVVAWSFGVYVADTVCRDTDAVWGSAVAFGGTTVPVDDSLGIPVAVFEGTLENMSEQVLHKFRRRMCGKGLEHFMSHVPERQLDGLKAELAALGAAALGAAARTAGSSRQASGFHWTKAVAGRGDLIFPFANQCMAWEEAGVELVQEDAAHYDVRTFERLLGGDFFEG